MRIALLEDDPDQSALLQLWLEDAENTVFCHSTGSDFLRAVRRDSFDIYILDWVLPDMSGIAVLRSIRRDMQDNTPTLLATVKNEERSVVQALETGADDYLVKPIRQRELVARVNAVLRRSAGTRMSEDGPDAAPYHFSIADKRVSLDGKAIELTNREFDLALFLFRRTGSVVSRPHILEAIWGIDNSEVTTRTVDTHISRLRKKLDLNEKSGWKLSAVYQHGYRLERLASISE